MEESKNNEKEKIDFSKEVASIYGEAQIVDRSKSREREELEEARIVINFYADHSNFCMYDGNCTSVLYEPPIRHRVLSGGEIAREHKKKWGF